MYLLHFMLDVVGVSLYFPQLRAIWEMNYSRKNTKFFQQMNKNRYYIFRIGSSQGSAKFSLHYENILHNWKKRQNELNTKNE